MNRPLHVAIYIAVIFAGTPNLRADLSLHALFTDHAVLQQELPVPVWGDGHAGDTVTVEFAGQKKTTTVKDDDTWIAVLDPLKASAEPAKLTVTSGDASVVVKDLLVGEVWVCSGQSNMAMAVRGTTDAELVAKEVKDGAYANIRLFKVPVDGADDPQRRLSVSWQTCDENNMATFSATGFYFGRALHASRKVPIGLIQSANGGTNAYSWINSETYQKDPVAQPAKDHFKRLVEVFPQAQARYEKQLEEWKTKVAQAKIDRVRPEGRAPRAPIGPTHVKRPTGHYNAMIAPLQPYAIRGAIWYQGEANSRNPFAQQYRDLMLGLIEDWRADWPQGSGLDRRDFPFFVVQLPNYANGDPWGWPLIREQMYKIWKDGKNTGMVATIDVGDPTDIHPKNKRPVGERLAIFARGTVYGEDITYSGPVYSSVVFEQGTATVTFDHSGSGLVSKDAKPLKHFEIADESGTFWPGQATINGNTVTVKSPSVKKATAVRYAWSNNPEGANFANKEGLMAVPFRTDTGALPPPQ